MALKHQLLFPLLAFSLIASNGHAEKSISLGATISGSGWNGNNGPGRNSFESDEGSQFALSVNYRNNQFYTGLNLQGGDYTFLSNAPDQFTSKGNLSSSNVEVAHNDLDLLVGYYFWSNVSLFVDLKSVQSKWLANGYEQSFGGLGFGVSGFHVINPAWVLFANAGFVNGEVKDSEVTTLGDGKSSALVGGAVYRIDQHNTINFSLKFRRYEFDYNTGNKQEYNLNGLFFGYNHLFEL
ncbi:MAG: hypothetical protein ACI9LO_003171 [Planctomycetota bacterium]|jgi:hypothetical protein